MIITIIVIDVEEECIGLKYWMIVDVGHDYQKLAKIYFLYIKFLEHMEYVCFVCFFNWDGMDLKLSSVKWWIFCLGLNMLSNHQMEIFILLMFWYRKTVHGVTIFTWCLVRFELSSQFNQDFAVCFLINFFFFKLMTQLHFRYYSYLTFD